MPASSSTRLNAAIGSLGWSNVRLVAETVKKKGFRATQITVEHEPEHKHRHLHHITAMIDGSVLTAPQKELAGRIFQRLAEAEAKVHNSTIEKVHFHEVGAVDSICDIVGAAIGWDLLGVERIVASPVPTGSGFVEIAHGRCAIPAPATAELLQRRAAGRVARELRTDHAHRSGDPGGAGRSLRSGAGDDDRAHRLWRRPERSGRAGQPAAVARGRIESTELASEELWVLETNLDDTSGELIGHAISRLWEAGALDVYTTAIQMKKNRPGVMLSVLCEAGAIAAVEEILFRETTTLGVRRSRLQRSKLKREPHQVETPWGPVDGMLAWLDATTTRFSPEYESCRQAAEQHNVPLKAVYEAAQRAFRAEITESELAALAQPIPVGDRRSLPYTGAWQAKFSQTYTAGCGPVELLAGEQRVERAGNVACVGRAAGDDLVRHVAATKLGQCRGRVGLARIAQDDDLGRRPEVHVQRQEHLAGGLRCTLDQPAAAAQRAFGGGEISLAGRSACPVAPAPARPSSCRWARRCRRSPSAG